MFEAQNSARAPVRIDYEWEAQYWATRWGVSLDYIGDAVAKVGRLADDVARELGIPSTDKALNSRAREFKGR